MITVKAQLKSGLTSTLSYLTVGTFLAILIYCFILLPKERHAISLLHANVAYNLYYHNIPNINNALAHQIWQDTQQAELTDINFHAYSATQYCRPDAPFPVNDTIGYGVLIGLLWKCTHSLSLIDIIVLQIILYLYMIFLIYRIGIFLFAQHIIALYSTLMFILYFPMLALATHAVRDVWAAYGAIILLYAILSYLKKYFSLLQLIVAMIGVTICIWIRPALFFIVPISTVLLCGYAWQFKQLCRRITILLCVMWFSCISIFWVPFIWYNKTHYNRYIVSPTGQDLLEGLGEFENPWHHRLSDTYVAQFIERKYNTPYGTPEFDDNAKKEFLIAYTQYPTLFWRNIIRRIPTLIAPPLPWLFYERSPYQLYTSYIKKVWYACTHPSLWFDICARHLYMRLYFLLGYIGICLLLWHRNYHIVICILAVICAGMAKLPSHIEYRYLTPYYWVFCFALGYSIWFFTQRKNK